MTATDPLAVRLAEWERIAGEATPPPWYIDPNEMEGIAVVNGMHITVAEYLTEANAAHIATFSPALTTKLLAAVRALKALRAEVSGFVGCNEPALREIAGNANVNVLQHWTAEADQALTALLAEGKD